jgi:3-oxoacyl-[acyl-carrier-protein] synthase III
LKIKIISVATYYPENEVGNDYYINHFKKKGMELSEFYLKSGQDKRKIVDNEEETTFSLGLRATQKVLEQTGLKGSDIDLIIFTSQYPEYTIPSQATLIHNAIEGKRDSLAFDLNANCVGMTVGFDTAIKYMTLSKCFKRTLLIGADYATKHTRDDNIIYSYFGDLGCAAILEKSEDEDSIVDTVYSTITDEPHFMMFPGCGLSAIYRDMDKNEKKTSLGPWKIDIGEEVINQVGKLLDRNKLTINDVDYICMSQAAAQNVERFRAHFNVDENKVPFIGNLFGYTGTSSPFLTLHDIIQKGKIKRGDKVIMWSIGASFTTCGILFEY